ncbi:hypothetical protein [Paenibacillus sp. RC67]|uniref:hypothetical protein n=1 Tax=Paenibacillus sp. RC67 TaxID=3039392 RepID=UPI0024AD5D35|nr:hypothetical protein [Paenibacillus sp. RC67]
MPYELAAGIQEQVMVNSGAVVVIKKARSIKERAYDIYVQAQRQIMFKPAKFLITTH